MQKVIDYAIWQAITDLESRCRHRPTGLQIEVEDREHDPVVKAALEILMGSPPHRRLRK